MKIKYRVIDLSYRGPYIDPITGRLERSVIESHIAVNTVMEEVVEPFAKEYDCEYGTNIIYLTEEQSVMLTLMLPERIGLIKA